MVYGEMPEKLVATGTSPCQFSCIVFNVGDSLDQLQFTVTCFGSEKPNQTGLVNTKWKL